MSNAGAQWSLENMTGGRSPTGSTRSQSSGFRESPSLTEPFPKKSECLFPVLAMHICPKCEEIMRYPVQIKACGHRLCYGCYKNLLSGPAPRCPEDQMELEDKVPDTDTALNNEIMNLQVSCRNKEWNCKWEGTILEFQRHLKDCEFTDILCVNDCGAKFQKRFLQKHLDKDCGKKIISCPYCDDRHLREEKKVHLEDCPKLPLPCPNKCDKKLTIPREELEQHIEADCPRTKLMCEFEKLGCAHRASREKMQRHYKNEIITHVKLMYDLMTKQKGLLDANDQRLNQFENIMKEQNKRIGDLEKIAHSQLIWRIEDYTRKLKEAKAGNMDTLFSPTFTTSKHGYRLCASVCLNGDGKGKGSHVSVFVSVLKGAFDALLKWPFDYRVTFTLLDQTEDVNERKHIKFSIKPNPCPENEPFLGRPKLEKNASFGGAKFVKHDEIESRNYIKDDTLFLKITIDCDGLSEP
ncbi:TNF receptor-associated factor 4 isoform X2 [Exaiptasia diaphana]|uniref:TNF receptor-associated factor 4 n=1 Tax=Exaiptasia diaphana TaxID=2652724 RepID=A0A913Y5Y2_EXADI|nr:TNF receptor-associated factor 4 isoform X2 [Exaiptasia diaphana]